MEIPITQVENLILDWKKNKINKITKAKILRKYLDQKQLSLREFCKEFGIPKTTVHDWLMYERITTLDELKIHENGITKTELHKGLQQGKSIREIAQKKKKIDYIDDELDAILSKIKSWHDKKLMKSNKTLKLINCIWNELNKLTTQLEHRH